MTEQIIGSVGSGADMEYIRVRSKEAEPTATSEPLTLDQQKEVVTLARSMQLYGRHKGCRKHGSLLRVTDEQRYETTQHPLAVPDGKGGSTMLPPTVTDLFDSYRKGAKLFQCTGCKRTISIA